MTQWDLFFLILFFLIGLIGAYVVSYIRAKGKNLATKEDIAAITEKVEGVKIEYVKQLELLRQENRLLLKEAEHKYQLSVAALDKRLEKHQEAYALWWELMGESQYDEKASSAVLKCQTWWVHNSIYLAPEARKAFRDAYHAAFLRPDLLKIERTAHGKEHTKHQVENWGEIYRAGEVILKAVSLPSWGEEEYKPIKEPK